MPKFQETDDFIVDLREKKTGPAEPAEGRDVVEPQRRGFLHFVQYNNAFLVVLVAGTLAVSGLAFASEEVRSETIGAKQVEAQGVDNAILLETDLENFKMDFKITGVLEDDEQYLVSYSFVDLDIKDGAWQFIERGATRKIKKPFRQDLGLYLARQLAQEESARIKALKQEQSAARETGETRLVQVTSYSGLIGKVLDVTNRVFPGYEPVKKIEIETPPVNERLRERAQTGAADSMTAVYDQWVNANPELVDDLNSEDEGTPTDTGSDEEGEADEGVPAAENSDESDSVNTADPSPEPVPETETVEPAGEAGETDDVAAAANESAAPTAADSLDQ